jgi:hypothetical protein
MSMGTAQGKEYQIIEANTRIGEGKSQIPEKKA